MGCGAFKSIVVVIAIVSKIILAFPASAQGPSPIQCARERQQATYYCKGVIFGQFPSADCCKVIKTCHYECACPVIDAKLADLLDVKKVSNVLRDCGRVVPHHFKCGNLYFP